MAMPFLATRMKQCGSASRQWIDRRPPRSFMQRTTHAGEREVFGSRFAVSGNGNYMVNVKSRFLSKLR
jgi:hypothetical protein